MNKICFVNGSPRGNDSVSKCIIGKVTEMLGSQAGQVHEICVADSLRQNAAEKDFEIMKTSDSIVFVFPLYVDAIPSSMLEYMCAFEEYLIDHTKKSSNEPPRVYAIINNGFPEGTQNINALKIMAHYTARIGFRWRFGIGIGAGEFIRENKDKITAENRLYRDVYNALAKLAIELEGQETVQQSDIMTNPAIPRFLFMAAANYFWAGRAGKSGVDLKRKVWPDLL